MRLVNRIFTRAAIAAIVCVCSSPTIAHRAPPIGDTEEARSMADAGARWATQGVKIGEYMDDVAVYSLKGKSSDLATLWKDRPVLLVTASLTCPVARDRCPTIRGILDAHGPEVRTVIIYTIEAHPKGDNSPYRPDREWVTIQNEQANVLHRQPTSLEDRLVLARDFHTRMLEVAPLLVDAMDNSAWKAMGSGPNVAVLIDTDGRVVAKQGWFDADAMNQEITSLLNRRNEAALAAYETSKKVRPQMEAFIEASRAGDRSRIDAFFSPHARMWFDQKSGPGNPKGASPWRAWDAELNAKHTIESARIHVNAVTINSHEVNDFSRLIDFAGWRAKSTYWFNDEGQIIEQLYEPQSVTPSMQECFKPALDWVGANMPDELRAIYPNNEFMPSTDTAHRWRDALIAWRKATGLPSIQLQD